ncbi:MAG: YfhO family protein [Chloroflexota bacterium]
MEQVFERRPWLVPVVLALLTIIFLKPIVFPDPNTALNGADFRTLFYPLHQYIRETVQAGELPLWNPRIYIGHPVIGDPHAALLYPATWFMWLVGVERGMNLSMVFHMWLAAWGMARLTRSFGSTHVGGILAGIVYAMSGWAAARFYAGHYQLYVVFAWIPWALVAYRYALRRGTWRSGLPGAAVLGAAILAGHPPMLVYLVISLGTMWIFHIAQSDDPMQAAWRATRQLAFIAVSGAILGAALLLPAAELTDVSVRTADDLGFVNSFALPPAQYISLALPTFFGTPGVSQYGYWGMDFYQEFTAYAGLLPLLAIPLAFRLRRREAWYFIGMVAFGLVLSIGVEGALVALFYQWIPGFSLFRVPARGLFFVVLGMAGLTALLVSALQRGTPASRRELLRPAVRLWVPVATAIAFAGAVFLAGWYSSASHVQPMPLRALIDAGAFGEAGVILLGVWFALWLWTEANPKVARWALILTCLIITLDAWHIGIRIIQMAPIQEDPIWTGARTYVPTGADARVVAPYGFWNVASATGHLDVNGDDPLEIETYNKLDNLSDDYDPLTPVNTLLGVKYMLADKPYDKPNFELIGKAGSDLYYRRTDPFPRAWIAQNVIVEGNDDAVLQHITSGKEDLRKTVYIDRPFDCPTNPVAGAAAITTYRPNDVTIATSGSGGLLVLSDQFYTGWQASVDGKDVETVRTLTAFRGVCVPAGDHTVQFKYRPLSFYAGVIISVVGWLSLLIYLMALYRTTRSARAA